MTVLAGTPGDVYDAPKWTAEDPHVAVMPPARSVHLGLASTFPTGIVAAHNIISAKLNQLHQLEDGWLGPGSLAPTPGALDYYRQFLITLGDAISLDAEAVAAGEGTLQVEWETDGGKRLIEFSDRGAWLYESRNGEGAAQVTVEPFDVQRVLCFFHGQPL
jgi:hypothetical protein